MGEVGRLAMARKPKLKYNWTGALDAELRRMFGKMPQEAAAAKMPIDAKGRACSATALVDRAVKLGVHTRRSYTRRRRFEHPKCSTTTPEAEQPAEPPANQRPNPLPRGVASLPPLSCLQEPMFVARID